MKKRNGNWILALIVMGICLILTHSCKKDEEPTDKITDNDGNTYTSVTIGTQVWLVENLKTTRYNDGIAIPNVSDAAEWSNLTTAAFCWYNNNTSYKSPYGALYNWHTANSDKLCPKGWHVPSAEEWNMLITNSGGSDIAGGKLKEAGTAHWYSPNTGAINESGFTALPGSQRDEDGSFSYEIGYNGLWWTTTDYSAELAHGIWISNDFNEVFTSMEDKRQGYSVRCIKD